MYTTILNSSFTKNIKNIIIYTLLTSVSGSNISMRVRPYLIYNQHTMFHMVVPHMAVEVRICDNDTMRCVSGTYGLVNNGRVYSPDILTSGRTCVAYKAMCGDNCKPCKNDIFPGYNKKYMTAWVVIKNQEEFVHSITKRQVYNPLFENCASFVASAMRAGGIDLHVRHLVSTHPTRVKC